jgi:hypothetical protein
MAESHNGRYYFRSFAYLAKPCQLYRPSRFEHQHRKTHSFTDLNIGKIAEYPNYCILWFFQSPQMNTEIVPS